MRVTAIRIENFRGIKQLKLELDETTVLIGENNSGKTAVLAALRLCLQDLGSRRRTVFDILDFHLPDADADPSSAKPIQIEVSFSEQKMDEWNEQLVGRLNRDGILQVGDDGRNHVLLRVTCKYDSASRDFARDWSFLNLDRDPLPRVGSQVLTGIQQEVPYFYLTALRDAAYHFDANGPFWRPFLKDTQLPVEKKTEIEQKLREVNELVVGSHASFGQVRTALRQVQDVVPLTSGDVVSIEAVPGRMFDMLAKAQIHLGTMTGAKIPVERHGEGTQSLAVLMLFSAFLKLWSDKDPIVALEEPEAHLHPSAVRALWHLVHDFSGQKLISTHKRGPACRDRHPSHPPPLAHAGWHLGLPDSCESPVGRREAEIQLLHPAVTRVNCSLHAAGYSSKERPRRGSILRRPVRLIKTSTAKV